MAGQDYTKGRGPLKDTTSAVVPVAWPTAAAQPVEHWPFPVPTYTSAPVQPTATAPSLGDVLARAAVGTFNASPIAAPVTALASMGGALRARMNSSGGEMPPAPPQTNSKPPAAQTSAQAAPVDHPAGTLTGFLGDLLADPNVRKMNVRQLTALAGLMPASMVRPVPAADAAAYKGMSLDEQIYNNTLAAADEAAKAGNEARAQELRTSAAQARLETLKSFAKVDPQKEALAALLAQAQAGN